MTPENGTWLLYGGRVTRGLLGIGWFEDGRIRWSTYTGNEDGKLLDRMLEVRLGEWVAERPPVSLAPPSQEPFRLSNDEHAGAFFLSFDGEPLRAGLRLVVLYNPALSERVEPAPAEEVIH